MGIVAFDLAASAAAAETSRMNRMQQRSASADARESRRCRQSVISAAPSYAAYSYLHRTQSGLHGRSIRGVRGKGMARVEGTDATESRWNSRDLLHFSLPLSLFLVLFPQMYRMNVFLRFDFLRRNLIRLLIGRLAFLLLIV